MSAHVTHSTLPQDVLIHVFERRPCDQALYDAALVCRAWTYPAQFALYQELVYSIVDNRPRDVLLARTMRTSPHLRRHVRRLKLVTLWNHAPIPELCDWIKLLPTSSLQAFQWTWFRGHLIPAVFDYPAVKTVTRLVLEGPIYVAQKLQQILELPSLESLSVELAGWETGSVYLQQPTRLRHLDLELRVEYGLVVNRLLAAVGSQLRSLRLSCKLGHGPQVDSQLVSTIETHCPNLTHLDLNATRLHSSLDPEPFMDNLITRYPAMQHISCTECVFTQKMFDNLPTSLKTMNLLFPSNSSLLPKDALHGFLASRARDHSNLVSVVVSVPSSHMEDCAEPAAAIRRQSNIEVHLVPVIDHGIILTK